MTNDLERVLAFRYMGYVSGVRRISTIYFTIKFKKLVRYIDIITDQTSSNNFLNSDTVFLNTNRLTNQQTNNQANNQTTKQANKQAYKQINKLYKQKQHKTKGNQTQTCNQQQKTPTTDVNRIFIFPPRIPPPILYFIQGPSGPIFFQGTSSAPRRLNRVPSNCQASLSWTKIGPAGYMSCWVEVRIKDDRISGLVTTYT